jgi:SAM-dependent methyltransferase
VFSNGAAVLRVLRHLPAIEPARQLAMFGSDYNSRSIDWCAEHIPNATFRVNQLRPPVPFEDDTVDCLYSGSVYTHLPPWLQQEWLADNLCVVRPGGIVMVTVHGDSYRSRLTPAELDEYDRDRAVVRAGVSEGGPWYTTYQSPRQVEHELLRGLGHRLSRHAYRPEASVSGPLGRAQIRWLGRRTR